MNHLLASRLNLVMPVTSMDGVRAFHFPSTAKNIAPSQWDDALRRVVVSTPQNALKCSRCKGWEVRGTTRPANLRTVYISQMYTRCLELLSNHPNSSAAP